MFDSMLRKNGQRPFISARRARPAKTPSPGKAAKGTGTTMAGGRPLQTGTALARLSWELLWENALPALEAVRAGEDDGWCAPVYGQLLPAWTLILSRRDRVPLLRYYTVFNLDQTEGIPAGKIPAASRPRARVVRGVCSEGLSTQVLPAASAGPSFHAAIISG